MYHYAESGAYQHFIKTFYRQIAKFGKYNAKLRKLKGTLYPTEMELLLDESDSEFHGFRLANAMIAIYPLLIGYAVAVGVITGEVVANLIPKCEMIMKSENRFVLSRVVVIAVAVKSAFRSRE